MIYLGGMTITYDTDALITITQAAKLAGVTTRTVRRWIDQKHLRDEREVKDKRTPVVISQRHLVAFLSTRGVTPEKGHVTRHDIGHVTPETPTVSQGELDALRKLIDELQRDKNRMIDDLHRERERNRELSERIQALHERINTLEREIHSLGGSGKGIAGYLTDGLRKLIKR